MNAFGLTDVPRRLPGGEAWRVADLVLKRLGTDSAAWLDWEERVLFSVSDDEFRLQRPRRTLGGALTVDGWFARDHLPGAHRSGRWPEIIAAADALHAAFAELPESLTRPPPSRTDPWAVADRIAWDLEPMPPGVCARDRGLRELLDARRPVASPSQLVHGDLTGNVLFADHLSPAIIDFSPYWRPPAYAIGVIVADAVVWEEADVRLLELVADRAEMGQCLLRALIFRHVTALLLPGALPTGDPATRYASLRRSAIRLSER